MENIAQKAHLDTIYQDFKTGDILYNNKNIYILYQKEKEILVITKGSDGYLKLEPIHTIMKGQKLLWVSLLEPLSYNIQELLDESLRQFYPPSQSVNIVFIHSTYRDFIKIPNYTAKILMLLDILKVGGDFNCINDPVACMPELYKNSGFIYSSSFESDNIIELI